MLLLGVLTTFQTFLYQLPPTQQLSIYELYLYIDEKIFFNWFICRGYFLCSWHKIIGPFQGLSTKLL